MKIRDHLCHRRYPAPCDRRYPAPCDRVTDHRSQFYLRWQDHLDTLRPHQATHSAADGPVRRIPPAACSYWALSLWR
jgi:hypothetical protein